MADDEQTIGDAATGAEEQHLEEAGRPGHERDGEDAEPGDEAAAGTA